MPLSQSRAQEGIVVVDWIIERNRAECWQHLTDPEHFPEWLGELRTGALTQGAQIVVDHGGDYLCTSVVEHFDAEGELAMTWSFPDEPTSRLTLKLTDTSGDDGSTQSLLHLEHEDLGDLSTSYLPGWMTHLTYFESSLEGSPLPHSAFWRLFATFARLASLGRAD